MESHCVSTSICKTQTFKLWTLFSYLYCWLQTSFIIPPPPPKKAPPYFLACSISDIDRPITNHPFSTYAKFCEKFSFSQNFTCVLNRWSLNKCLFKTNNKYTQNTSAMLFWCLHYQFSYLSLDCPTAKLGPLSRRPFNSISGNNCALF